MNGTDFEGRPLDAELPAGRELDAQVAGRVMGWTGVHDAGPDEDGREMWRGVPPYDRHLSYYHSAEFRCYGRAPLPSYSTMIGAAWAVIEKLREDGRITCMDNESKGRWFVSVSRNGKNPDTEPAAWGNTAPEAICRAALLVASSESETPNPPSPTPVSRQEKETR